MDLYENSNYRKIIEQTKQDNEQEIVANAQAQAAVDNVAEAMSKDENGSR